MILLLVFGSALFGHVMCQTKYCCTPTQWESQNYILTGQDTSGTPSLTTGDEALTVDGTAQIIASSSNLTVDGVLTNLKIIQDFKNGTQYSIQGGACKATQLPAWTPLCIPDSAVMVADTYFGDGGNMLDVQVFRMIQGPNTVFLNIAKTDCTPVYVTAFGSQEGVSAISQKTYSNVTLGIKDRSVFDIPDICKHMQTSGGVPVSAKILY